MTDLTTLFACVLGYVVLDKVLPLLERLVAIREGELALRAKPAPRQEQVSIPPDLYAVAQSYEDVWAREQAELALREMYGELGSWDMVRLRFSPDKGDR